MQKKNTSQEGARQSVGPFTPGTTASDRVVRTPESDGGRPVDRFTKEPGSGLIPATGSPPLKVLGEGTGRGRGEQSEPRPPVRFGDSDTPSGDELTQAWRDLIGRWEWGWFVTLTFRDERTHPEKAEREFNIWVSKINRYLYGPRWFKQGKSVRWVRASERQHRGAIHYHALLGGKWLSELRRLAWMDEWEKQAGWARIEPPRSSEAVRAYCVRIPTKGSHPFRLKRATCSARSGPPVPTELGHPSERSDAGGVVHAEAVLVGLVFGSFLRIEGPLSVMW